jgi:hypothetical protein
METPMKVKYLLAFVTAIISLVLLAGCSGYSSQAPAASAPTSQTAAASSNPTTGVNDSPTHTVTSDTGVWDSGNLSPGKSFSFTFNQVGTFPYHCNIHSSMTAKIVVQ